MQYNIPEQDILNDAYQAGQAAGRIAGRGRRMDLVDTIQVKLGGLLRRFMESDGPVYAGLVANSFEDGYAQGLTSV